MTQPPVKRDLAAEVDELRSEIKVINDNTKAVSDMLTGDPVKLFSLVNNSKKRWDTSTTIAVLAFLFSFGSTLVSYVHTNNQDTSSAKAELRTLIQRLSSIAKETSAANRYRQDPGLYNTIVSSLNQENVVIAGQADALIRKLPKSEVTATDYESIAYALVQSSRLEKAALDATAALAISQEPDDDASAHWLLARVDFAIGKTSEARAHYQAALDVFGQKYRSADESTKQGLNIQTELNWAVDEKLASHDDQVEQHLRNAEGILKSMPPSTIWDVTKLQIDQMRKGLTEAKAPSDIANPRIQSIVPLNIAPAPPPPPPLNPIR
jgi:tetratricopeptide (TPR) repeat protein